MEMAAMVVVKPGMALYASKMVTRGAFLAFGREKHEVEVAPWLGWSKMFHPELDEAFFQ